jgi:hypothetical protein
MRRAITAMIIAAVVTIILLFVFGPRQNSFQKTLCIVGPTIWDCYVDKYFDLDYRGRWLALQLDLIDNLGAAIGFPAIAVFGLWTMDRGRKEKKPA